MDDIISDNSSMDDAAARRRERTCRAAHKYYITHREVCLEKAKAYREKNHDRIVARDRAWRAQNRDKETQRHRLYRETYAEQILVRRRELYRQNPEPTRARYAAYYARAMNARQAAVNVCPVWLFMLELRARKDAAYKEYGANRYSFVQRALAGCPALTAMDAGLCPMVANPEIAPDQMLAKCTMPKIFEIPNAWNQILIQAILLNKQHQK